MANPFRPTFGSSPPLLVGRDHVIQEFEGGLLDGAGAPARTMLITGARGSGKTVLLNRLEKLAEHLGWIRISVSTRPGMVQELVGTTLVEALRSFGPEVRARHLTGVAVNILGNGGTVNWQNVSAPEAGASFRSLLFSLSDLMEERGGGVLLSVDEIHRGAVQDLRIIAQELQHAIREDKAVAFLGAGLPEAVGDLLNDDVLTFLRRAERHSLGTVDPDDVAEALDVPLTEAGRRITTEALELAAAGTRGYPYLIQGVGHGIWRASEASNALIGIPQAEEGVRAAIRRIGSLVHAASLANLSDVDKSFLAAMAVDDGPSRMRDLQKRLGVDPQYTNTYKQRLLERGLIQQVSRGVIDFAIPYLRDYLREHVVTQHLQSDESISPPEE